MTLHNRQSLNVSQLAQRLALVLALLLTQFAGSVHASVHDFHDHAQSCDLFQAMERTADTVSGATLSVVVDHRSCNDFQYSISLFAADRIPARSRDPPFFL